MKKMKRLNRKGVTLIELLIALVICGMVAAGIYQVFIAQSKAYTVQDQVIEVQQSVRSAMEILLRDLRMAGFDNDNLNSDVRIDNPLVTPVQTSDITINYEYYQRNDDPSILESQKYESHQVRYWRDAGDLRLRRTITKASGVNDGATTEIILENVDTLDFTYGVDVNEDGALDTWVPYDSIKTSKVIAVRVTLTARPVQINPDTNKMISPRTLVSNVTLRNLCLVK